MNKSIAVAAALAFVLGVAGCGADDGSTPAGTRMPSASSPDLAGPVTGSTEGATGEQISAAGLPACPASAASVSPVPDGLPDLTLPCLGVGPDVHLPGLAHRPMVVTGWASWCSPCAEELPIMADVARSAQGKVDFLGIDVADQRAAGLEMAKQTHMSFASVQAPELKDRAALKMGLLPSNLFVRADGTIAGRAGQINSAAQLRELIATYLDVQIPE